ncbi:PilZ domain-containing protein [Erythrobacter sp. GH1-10]|uniref:PilZ domain-containing protein n=1 Tax=Erythrobacter sp. GH1-10 TaxID=3349334 RepID=UPI0038780385
MSSLALRQQAAQADRRRSGRFSVEIPAALRTVSGTRECRMANISDGGAMLELPSPPPEGVCGCLVLGKEEIYCRVVWASETSCGIEFERAIGGEKLAEIAGEQVQRTGPIANVGRIQMGRKRSGLVTGS